MLLFSTTLRIKDTMTRDSFINMVIEWNQNSPHEENVIPGLIWNGEENIRFGNDKLWMEILEYKNKNIVAVRFEKMTEDGVTWDSDYVMNFDEMKLSIQLDRSYSENSLGTNAFFSTPYIITTLIEHGYLEDDGNLPVNRYPIMITKDNLDLVAKAVAGENSCQLPIVFVSKTIDNEDPVDVRQMASRLKGIAHVFVQEDRATNFELRALCNDRNDYNGAIGIYYPNETLGHKRSLYRDIPNIQKILLENSINYVMSYGNLKSVPSLYTWEGVNNALLYERFAKQREARRLAEQEKVVAQNEVSDVYDALDEELQELQNKVKELTNRNEALTYENQGLSHRLMKTEGKPILFQGEETDFYADEIKDFVLLAVSDAIANSEEGTRKHDVLSDILAANNFEHLSDARHQQLKRILKGYKNISASMRQELINLGFDFSEDGKHYKLTYRGDDRYQFTLAKTPSDHRSGDNIIGTISRKIY